MAVIGWAIGGIIVASIAYDDYSDYSDYDNYSNYSDAAERRRRRIEAKENEIHSQVNITNTYKIENVNDYLKTKSLKEQSGVDVALNQVNSDALDKINSSIDNEIKEDTKQLSYEVEKINIVIEKIDKILEENKKKEG